MEMKVQPLGLHIETALVSEVVLWVLELSDKLKTRAHRRESALHHLANLLDAEDGTDAASLVDLRYRRGHRKIMKKNCKASKEGEE